MTSNQLGQVAGEKNETSRAAALYANSIVSVKTSNDVSESATLNAGFVSRVTFLYLTGIF